MIPPQLSDWHGHPYAKADARADQGGWEFACLAELIERREASLPVTFKIPTHNHGDNRA